MLFFVCFDQIKTTLNPDSWAKTNSFLKKIDQDNKRSISLHVWNLGTKIFPLLTQSYAELDFVNCEVSL